MVMDRLAHDEARLAIAQGHIELALGALAGRFALGLSSVVMHDMCSTLRTVHSAVMTARDAIEDASHANS